MGRHILFAPSRQTCLLGFVHESNTHELEYRITIALRWSLEDFFLHILLTLTLYYRLHERYHALQSLADFTLLSYEVFGVML